MSPYEVEMDGPQTVTLEAIPRVVHDMAYLIGVTLQDFDDYKVQNMDKKKTSKDIVEKLVHFLWWKHQKNVCAQMQLHKPDDTSILKNKDEKPLPPQSKPATPAEKTPSEKPETPKEDEKPPTAKEDEGDQEPGSKPVSQKSNKS